MIVKSAKDNLWQDYEEIKTRIHNGNKSGATSMLAETVKCMDRVLTGLAQ